MVDDLGKARCVKCLLVVNNVSTAVLLKFDQHSLERHKQVL